MGPEGVIDLKGDGIWELKGSSNKRVLVFAKGKVELEIKL